MRAPQTKKNEQDADESDKEIDDTETMIPDLIFTGDMLFLGGMGTEGGLRLRKIEPFFTWLLFFVFQVSLKPILWKESILLGLKLAVIPATFWVP